MTSPLRRGHVASLCLTLVGVPSGRRNGVFVWYRTVAARSATDRLRLPAHVYGTAFPRRFVTYHWQFTLLANILTHFFSSWARPRRICDIYDFFAPYTNVLTYLLSYYFFASYFGHAHEGERKVCVNFFVFKYFNICVIVCSESDHLNKKTMNYFNGGQ